MKQIQWFNVRAKYSVDAQGEIFKQIVSNHM
jgi:hypothetical protein